MTKIFDFGHQQGVKTVDGFEFEMKILILLYGRFEVDVDDGIDVSELPEKLEDAFMADFAYGDFDAAEVEYHLAE